MIKKLTFLLAFIFLLPVFHSVEAAGDTYFDLWNDEATSKSYNPSGLDDLNTSTNVYTNHFFGYQFTKPVSWVNSDRHQIPNYTRFYDQNFRVDIFYENTTKISGGNDTFINETIQSIQPYMVSQSDFVTENGLDVTQVHYQRNPISGITNDLTAYSYYFVKVPNAVYVFQLKTDVANWELKKSEMESMLDSFQLVTKSETDVNASFTPSSASPNIEYKEGTNTLSIPSNKITFGLYEPVSANNKQRETELGTHFGSQMMYQYINHNYDPYVDTLINDNKVPLITFQFYSYQDATMKDAMIRTLNGEYDANLSSWSTNLKRLDSPVFVRIGNEMNANWVPWSQTDTYNDPDLYKMTYRYVVDYFRDTGTSNVKFVWNPNENSKPFYNWNNASVYYPGDEYVDWLGMTSYNFGKTSFSEFEYFDDLYKNLYKTYMRSFADKPIMIGEFASVEAGGNKPYFITQMFSKILSDYPNLKLVIWFNHIHDPYDLRYNSTSASEMAFRDGLKNKSIVQYPMVKTVTNGLYLVSKENESTYNSSITFTGVVHDPLIEKVYVNDIEQRFFSPSWRQFDQPVTLQDGRNTITIKVEKAGGQIDTYTRNIIKIPSFKFSTNVGKTPSDALSTTASNLVVTGLVSDAYVKTMKANGVNVPINYSWRQFDASVGLVNGMNEIILRGYNASGVEIVVEKVYVFKDGDLKVTSPSTTTSTHHSTTKVITGMASNSSLSSVRVDGELQTLNYAWRQFDHTLTLDYGWNHFYIDAIYKGMINGLSYEYSIHRLYSIQAPSFSFTTKVGLTPNTASLTTKTSETITGLVKNSNVKSLRINGQNVPITSAWKQFDAPVTLKPGLNVFKLVGYSDASYTNKLIEETVYIFNTNVLKITSPSTSYSNLLKQNVTITGYAPQGGITLVKVNGIVQTLKYSWIQFDQPLTLSNRGDNMVTIDAVYSGMDENKRPYQISFQKQIVIHTPSFDYGNNVGLTISSAPQTDENSISFSLKNQDVNVKSISVNGVNGVLNADGTFSKTLSLQSGLNAIKVVGFSDTAHSKKLFEETVFVFNRSGLSIKEPTNQTSSSLFKEINVSGFLTDSKYKWIKLNGVTLTTQYDWRQFLTKVTLPVGENNLKFTALYESTYNGVTYTYLVEKNYTVIIPEEATSFNFTTTNFGYTPETAYHTINSKEWIGALIKNGNMSYIMVNGVRVEIMNSWREMNYGVPLVKGLNEITIVGYDSTNTAIETKKIYIHRD